MAYRFKASESVPEGIKRIVLEEVDSATELLSRGNSKKRGEAIHEARKSVKKIRGVLRLVQPELGGIYSTENTRLGDLGRTLSEIRDAEAIIETFDGLLDQYKENLRIESLAPIRRGLERSKRETEQTANVDAVVRRAISTLRAAGRRVKAWPLKNDGFQAIAPGLENAFRRGRKAMAAAQKNSRPENYHDWRKRVKDHWYHIRLLENLWTEVMQAHEASLKNLETWLGDDHNLVVLCGKVGSEPEKYGDERSVQLFLTLAGQHQKELRENSLSLGERVFEEKPKQFTQKMSNLWDAWQQQPESMKEIEKEERKPPGKQPGQADSAPAKTAVA
ncbi:MAG: CHAD domain-containing protein [Bryobacteraceae bacterium]